MSPEKITELEEMFYEECTNRKAQGQYMLVNKVPKDVFQWIVDNVIKAKEEEKECTHESQTHYRDEWMVCDNCGKSLHR